MKKILIISSLLWFGHSLSAQNKQDYFWIFGDDGSPSETDLGYWINFNEKPALPVLHNIGTMMNAANASICDKDGNLLFYSNGSQMMTRHATLMENGDSLNYDEWVDLFWYENTYRGYPGGQDILILEDPGSENEYYIIHKTIIFNGFGTRESSHLYFSKVDLSLNEGEGKVILKNEPLYKESNCLFYYLTAIRHKNGKDWWLVQPLEDDDIFLVFLINGTGIHRMPDQSTNHYFSKELSSGAGTARFSPDGTKYALYNYNEQLHLYDFNRQTGKFSNHRHIKIYPEPDPEEIRFSSVEWSASSRFIYTATTYELHQVDTWKPNIQENGIILIDEYDGTIDPFHTTFYLMALAPDCRIYMCPTSSTNAYHVINNPNTLGKSCGFVQNGIKLPTSSYFGSMPNFPRFRVDDAEKCDPTIVSVFGQPVFYRRDLEVFPNPSSGLITVQKPEVGSGRIMVMDMQGTLLETQLASREDDKTTLDLSHLPPGTYLIEYYPDLQKDRIFYSAKVVVAR